MTVTVPRFHAKHAMCSPANCAAGVQVSTVAHGTDVVIVAVSDAVDGRVQCAMAVTEVVTDALCVSVFCSD